MAVSTDSDVEKKLAALQQMFKQQLPDKLREVNRLWDDFSKDTSDTKLIERLHRIAHSLAGSGGTFGAASVGSLAREVEIITKSFLQKGDKSPPVNNQIYDQVVSVINQLCKATEQWQPADITYLQADINNKKRDSNLIYLAEDDNLCAEALITSLEKAGYCVQHFLNLSDFEIACKNEIPSAVIIDMVFTEGDFSGADIISKLKVNGITCPPLIFISAHNDIDNRLAAARAGARRYFTKPVDVKKLIGTLNGLTARMQVKPYRVLLVDDDEILMEYYATVLREAGMEVMTLNQPLMGLDVINKFRPEIVVTDVYMPDCTGPELAQVIRQDDAYAQMPIMFLSTETDINQQLAAMNLGGDDFLVKPVESSRLVAAVVARAKRSRWINRLNNELQMALAESQFQVVTSDQHNIVSTTDVAGNITHVNDKFCEISGYSREELIGQNHRMLKSGFHPGSFYEDMWTTISFGKVWHGTICNLGKNGHEYWVESTIVPFLDEKGKPYKYVSARTDVTLLRTSEERLNRSQVFANIGTWDWNIKTGELFWSDRIWPLFGYVKEVTETTYENFLAAVHPDDRQDVIDAVTNCIEKGSDYNIEHRVVWPDESIHWVHERGDVVRSHNGVPLHMLGVVQDIDYRKLAELEVEESQRQLIEAQSLASIGSWQADMVNGGLIWSDEIYRIFGYEPGSFVPSVEAFHGAVYPDDLAKVRESEIRAEKTGHHDVEHRIVQPDGTVRHVHELARAEVDSQGDLLRITGTVQDVTEQVEIKEALLRYKTAMESTVDGIAILNADGKYLYMNMAHVKIYGYFEKSELLGKHWTCLYGDVEKQDFEDRIMPKFLVDGQWSGESIGTKKDGSTFPQSISLTALGDGGLICIVRDISESKKIEAALLQAKEEAENANRAKSQFLSSMSHELRTPMNAIIGFSQLLKMEMDAPLNESQTENVDEIFKAGNHLLELINEVLDLARIEAGHIDLSVETILLGETILESVQLISPLANNRNIEVSLTLNGEEVSIEGLLAQNNTLHADRVRLKQVLLNLLSNAVKYNCENGKIIIACDNIGNNQTRISIIDTGEGMSSDQQTQLFMAFNRLGAEQSDIEGTGIGLVITKNIIELMGGNIGVHSEQGKGSTFWIELPSDSLSKESQATDKLLDGKNHTTQFQPSRNHDHTVLYIEDNPANLRLVNQLFGHRPHIHMWSAHEPLSGIELAVEHNPDLILLDINLPGMSGFEVLTLLRQQKETRNIPVIAVSANAMPKDIEKGLKAGFTDYITKPLDIIEFFEAIDKVLR